MIAMERSEYEAQLNIIKCLVSSGANIDIQNNVRIQLLSKRAVN